MEVLEALRDDVKYYGEYGQKYLSNSDIGKLLNNPKMFRKEHKPSVAMILGRYFHTIMLEEDKIGEFKICDSSTRTTKVYKEMIADLGEDIILLSKEVEAMEFLASEVKKNLFFNEIIYDDDNEFEKPAIGEIGGEMWKGKADIVTRDLIVDLKTTSKIDDFKWSARRYNYDSQAWIYNQLFDKPMVFIVVEKGSGRTGMYNCSDEFLDGGKNKVFQALEVYKTFFGESPTENIDQFFINETL